jgi:biopolymer transport protein ExbD
MTNTKRPAPREISAGSMSDIAFLLLIYFLVTTTIIEDKGVLARLPEWSPDPPPALPVHERNVFSVMINAQNQVLAEGKFTDIGELRSMVKTFILNPEKETDLAENPSMAIIALKHDRATNYQSYIAVYNELKAAYNELWQERAIQHHQKNYSELTQAQQKKIRDAVPLVISESEPTEFGEEK